MSRKNLSHSPWRCRGWHIEIHAKEILYLKEKLNRLLAEHTGQPIETIERDTDRDNFMSAEQAVTYGLADKVLANRNDAALT